MVELLLICLVTGIAAAVIGSSKGRSWFGWFLIGFFFNVIGVLVAIGVASKRPVVVADAPPTRNLKKCPHCAELILLEASKCKHCGSAV